MENLENNKSMTPPHSIEIEESVIGSMLVDKLGQDEAMSILTTENIFYNPRLRFIFLAIKSLYSKGNPIDLITVSQELRLLNFYDNSGGDRYLITLTQKISSSAHIEYHSRLLLQKYMARQVIMFSSKIISIAYDPTTDIFELLQRWQKEFDEVSNYIHTGRTTISFQKSLQNLKESIQLLTNNKQEVHLVGIHTGFLRLNKYTAGYRPQDLVIVAARPGMGKTSYILKTALENCKINIPVGIISLEMSIDQLTARCVAIDTNFHLSQLLKKGFEKSEYFNTYTDHQERMKEYPLYIDDSGSSDINDIVITTKLWHRKYGIKLLILDYIQLASDKSTKGNREGEISSISRRLKKLAKELDITIIALSQLSRACETRGASKRPLLSDLRESGAIEQDADIVQFIYRPEYYKIDIDINDYDSSLQPLISAGANTEIIFAKYRGGSVNTTMLKWIGDKTKFIDVEDKTETESFNEIESNYVLPSVSYKDLNDYPF